ncbi:hypothetical protein E2C01_077380 [Portunus trituberculatus]|uniref:Uncharacterized protein n=1 Tax=Portunus trituberculatus TaxID=210409 RepID=A0A5B7IL92_PORTR|nr:hypothetical protein [Portunus trituberculatus]
MNEQVHSFIAPGWVLGRDRGRQCRRCRRILRAGGSPGAQQAALADSISVPIGPTLTAPANRPPVRSGASVIKLEEDNLV